MQTAVPVTILTGFLGAGTTSIEQGQAKFSICGKSLTLAPGDVHARPDGPEAQDQVLRRADRNPNAATTSSTKPVGPPGVPQDQLPATAADGDAAAVVADAAVVQLALRREEAIRFGLQYFAADKRQVPFH